MQGQWPPAVIVAAVLEVPEVALDGSSQPCPALLLPVPQLFANSDIGNLTKDKDCCPPKDYMEAQWGVCPPVQCERDRTFDFRHFCSTKVRRSSCRRCSCL